MHQKLATLVEGDREVKAIDVFRVHDGVAEVAATTRDTPDADADTLTSEQLTWLSRRSVLVSALPSSGRGRRWRIAVPLRRDGVMIGAAQAELWTSAMEHLNHWLRLIDTAMLLSSIALISLVLAFFLERRVTRPVAALVDGMRRAERGALGTRVALASGGELGFLTNSFNSMVGRIEELTAGLEARVQAATLDLEEKNRQLQAANENLAQAQFEAGRSERLAALGQMAATIAHELGTPLNSVLGYTQLLLRDEVSASQEDKLQVIESQVQRMIETIRSVLDRTRDRAVRRVPVPVRPLVEEALALVSARLSAADVQVRVEVPADLPPVPGEAIGLRQVLLNLLINAVDASDPGSTIEVSARVLAADDPRGRFLEIAVRDIGHGMSADDLRRVFEPFYTTKAPGRGTGLGLVIVDHIVRAHGGQMVVDSVPGQGTTMRVQLPLEG